MDDRLRAVLEADGDPRFWNAVFDVFDAMKYVEGAIERYQKRYPGQAGLLWDAFKTVLPPGGMLQLHRRLFQSHVEELLERVACGGDLKLATQAEVLLAIMNASSVSPLKSDACSLQRKLFANVFGEEEAHRLGIDQIPSHEQYPGAMAEDLEFCRRKLRVDERYVPDPRRYELKSAA